jgi:hypothetical protein
VRLFLILFLFFHLSVSAQELFPHTEPASTIPKNVLGVRYSLETFRTEERKFSSWNSLRIMYGLTPKLTLIASASISNHHTKNFPSPYLSNFSTHHSPSSSGTSAMSSSNKYLFEGIHLYGKYRFLSLDGEHSHLRVALYGEIAESFVAHRESDPILIGGTSGAGAGFIITKLHKKFAISATTGFISPFKYEEKDSNITFQSGKAFVYNLSIGYLLFPTTYKSYKDLNVNLYVEFLNKIFGKAAYVHHGIPVNVSYYPTLQAGQYSEVRPAIQFIVNSNLRVDASVSFLLYQKVETRTYPVYLLNIQRYFF